jgi:hypothetical protein
MSAVHHTTARAGPSSSRPRAWRAFVGALLLLGAVTAQAASSSYSDLMAEARAAMTRGDPAAASAALDAAQQLRPYSLHLTRNRIATRVASGRLEEALALATEVADRGLALDLSGDPYAPLRGHAGYAALAQRFEANMAAWGDGHTAAEIPDRSLLPEALLRDGEDWLVGSVRTGAVLRVGNLSAPVALLDGGIFDLERRGDLLVAAVNNQLAYEGSGEEPPRASVVEIDFVSGEVRRSMSIEGDALFGDIELAGDGSVYASDSVTPRIVSLRPGSDRLTELAVDPRFVNLQGLALDEGRGLLFVADYLAGLFAVDPATGKAQAIANPSGAHLGGIDGLYLHRGDLIGVQNGVSPQRIIRIRLDGQGTTALALEVLQQALPGWNEPTHGVVVGDEFHYLATSNWPAYGDDGVLVDEARLAPLRIMSVALR